MIGTGIDKRIQVQQIIENQLPEFLRSESPLSVDFLKQYYISQEHRGGVLDISDNLDQYLKLDNLTPEVVVGVTTLTSGISTDATTLTVSSTKGFPDKYGLFKIDDEVFTYTGITTNTFTGVVRGFSGITSYTDPNNLGELVFSTSTAGIHTTNSVVENLSVLFLKEFYKKTKAYLTPGLEDTKLNTNIDISNFIKESKSLYKSKGTEESFRILFNILYGLTPKIIDLENLLIKPSSAEYIRREVVVAQQISGDPAKLTGQTITKSNDLNTSASVSEVEIFSRSGNTGITTYYKLNLFIGFNENDAIRGVFTIPGKTRVIEDASVDSSILTVDSTVGFGTTGTIITNGINGINTITYNDKTINQFLNCSGIGVSIRSADDLRSDEFIFGYEEGDLTKRVEMRITGVVSNFELIETSGSSVTSEGEKVTIKNLGEIIPNPPRSERSRKTVFFNSWIYNTASRFNIVSEVNGVGIGVTSSVETKSELDISQLKANDKVSLIRKGETIPVKTGIVVQTIANSNQLDLDQPIDLQGKEHDLQRELDKTNAISGINLEFGNNVITSNVQNTYNDRDKTYFVASSSMPSYLIEKTVVKIEISDPSNDPLNTLQSGLITKNSISGLFKEIQFIDTVPFIDGDSVLYVPENAPIVGLTSSTTYYVKVIEDNAGKRRIIRLFPSRSFILVTDNDENPPHIELNAAGIGTGSHKFVLLRHKNEQIGTQKILRKFPAEVDIKSGNSVETKVGSTGILINGVEIVNYKSFDRIFYGKIEELKILNQGKNFDVINPPTIQISAPGLASATTALVQPVVKGKLEEVLVDQQNFDVDRVLSVTLSGGNGSGAVLLPVVTERFREFEFDGRLSNIRGGVDHINDWISFKKSHNLRDGEPLVYNNNGFPSIGKGDFGGSNSVQNKTLSDGGVYYPKVVGINSVYLYETATDYLAGINTIGFTIENASGEHKFRTLEKKKHLKSVKVIDAGTNYTNRKLIVKPVGISTVENAIEFKNHGFVTGDLVQYQPSTTLVSDIITGLSTTTRYRILKLDDDKFQLINVGLGATDPDKNFLRSEFTRITDAKTSNHEFFFEPVTVTVSAVYSKVSASEGRDEDLVITPKIRGSLVDAYVHEGGTDYGSEILNFEKKPEIKVLTGKNAELNPIIKDGKVISCDVRFGGKEYTSPPDLNVVGVGTGIGAQLRSVVSGGKITDVKVINSGIGYTLTPTLQISPAGQGHILDSSIRSLQVNNLTRFGDEILLRESETNLQYSVVGYSGKIQTAFGDTTTTPLVHSPIIGWAYDGNPIYGPYGYSEADNDSSAVINLRTGFVIDTSKVVNRPTSSTFTNGYFVEDHTYTNAGDLDESNGRYCKTPDFPNGTYAYFAGVSSVTSQPEFPYFIGDTFRSDPVEDNFILDQNRFDFNGSDLTRNTLPYKLSDKNSNYNFAIESYEIKDQVSIVESVTKGSINGFQIVSKGDNYKVGDSLNFDNEKTEGGGASALVERVGGVGVTTVTTATKTYDDVVMVRNGVGKVSGYIATSHNLTTNDVVAISGLSTSVVRLTNSHNIGVTSSSNVLYKALPGQTSAGVVTDIYLASIPSSVSVGSSIGIGTEKLLVLNTNRERSILRVKRGIVHPSNAAVSHKLGGLVQTIPQFFTIESPDIGDFTSKANDIVYFNPAESVGVGTTTPGEDLSGNAFADGRNVTIGKSFTIGELSEVISIPIKGIFIPNHPFKDNQKVILRKPTNAASRFAIGLGEIGQEGANFNLPASGNSQTVFIRKISDDVVGLALTANTDAVFFRTGDTFNNFEYSLESNFDQVTAKVQRITTTVSTGSSAHGLLNGDVVNLNLVSNQSKGTGITTSIVVKYSAENDKILLLPTTFAAADIISGNKISSSHGFKTGEKVYYSASSPATGLTAERSYFVYRIDDENFQLAETLYDVQNEPPTVVPLTAGSGGSGQQLFKVNPPLTIVRNDNLKFYVSDPSLNGYKLNFYFDSEFKNEFVSTGSTVNFGVTRTGASGIGTNSFVTLNYNSTNPHELFYTLEKTGFISTSDPDVVNASKVNYTDSEYNGSYKVFGITTNTFDVSLHQVPEQTSYTVGTGSTISYSTASKNVVGGVEKINLTSGGFGYITVPGVSSITSANGDDASILCLSDSINKISNVRITDPGFDYHSDKTLRPEARLSPTVTLINSDSIVDVNIAEGGDKYLTTPDLVVVDPDTGKLTGDQGIIQVGLTANSITSVEILESPRGLTNTTHVLRTINNTNGYKITNLETSNSGIVTCTLKTPINGFATPQFTVGEQVFVENIGITTAGGDGFNSPDNGFVFFNVTEYNNTDPAIVKFELPDTATNPGIGLSVQNFATIIKFSDYPQFTVTQKSSEFRTGENISVEKNNKFVKTDLLVIDNRADEFIKLEGSFEIKLGDKIRGENSGTVATINTLTRNKGVFNIDYSLRQTKGWNDEIGRLSEDFMVLGDNHYYQNLSYTIQSPKTFDEVIDPVNRLVHTSGLKNFADVGISSIASAGIGQTNGTIVSADIITEQRVDTINDFDLASDVDTIDNGTKSKFIKLKNTKLAKFIQCNTNRVLTVDNIRDLFSNADANLTGRIDVPLDADFARFLVQTRNIITGEIQLDEVVVLTDTTDTFTIEKNSIVSTASTIANIVGITSEGNPRLVIRPTDPNNDDLDIKILKNVFNTDPVISGNQAIGGVTLTGVTTSRVAVGSTTTIVSGFTTNFSAFYATAEVKDTTSGEKNHIDIYVTHDGTDSFFSEYYADTSSAQNFSSNFIGTFTSKLENNVIKLNFHNTESNEIQVSAKVVGFGTEGLTGLHRFKNAGQPDGTERTLILQSGISSVQSSAVSNIVGVDSNKFSAIRSIVKVGLGTAVGAGATHAIHQVVAIHNGSDTHTVHYPFVSIGSTSGIGTFSANLTSSNFVLKFHPDSGTGKHHIQHLSEVIYRDIDIRNIPDELKYGRISESVSVFQYNAKNGTRTNKTDFELKHNDVPIFAKTFNPTTGVGINTSTGVFSIDNHFFSDGEELVYTPKSTFIGVAATAMTTAHNTNVPSIVFAKKLTNDTFQIAATKGGTALTFATVGSGNAHQLGMKKKLEKSVLVVDGLIQSPMSFTPVTTGLQHNIGGNISSTTTAFSISGISSINIGDSLKFNDEFMRVNSVGVGTTTVGPVTGIGTYFIVEVSRGKLGTTPAVHSQSGISSIGRIFSGSFNIVDSTVHFTDPPRGTNSLSRNLSNLEPERSDFQGRVYLRKTYDANQIFDDVSTKFTGIEDTFRMTVGGANTTGITTGSSLVLINGIFQKPTTGNNLNNNYSFIEVGGSAQDIVFTGISSEGTGNKIISNLDVNQNQLPRGGMVVSVGSSGGRGVAPLIGAAVTGILNQFGVITAVGIGSTVYDQSVSPSRPPGTLSFGSGYRPVGGTVAIGITDLAYEHRFVSAGVGSIRTNASGNNIFAATQRTATNATYISHTGLLTLTIASHGLSAGNFVGIDTGSVVFTCSRDNFASNHAYPRALSKTTGLPDPIAGIATVITAVTTNTITAFIGFGGGAGTGASATGNIGVGGTLDINIGAGGTDYVNPRFQFPQPTYDNMAVQGVSRLGIGPTTDTGESLLVSLNVGSSSTVGIGSTLFEIESFKITRPGHSFKVGDVIKPVGLVTARGATLQDFTLEVTEIFTDKFSAWDFGEFDFIDPINSLQNGVRTRFPLRLNQELLSFDIGASVDSQLIDMNSLLVIYVNGVLQEPGSSYTFEGGTTFNFTVAPEPDDNITIFFYKGTSAEDVSEIDAKETIKDGDLVQLQANADVTTLTNANTRLIVDQQQKKRTVSGITTVDTFETEIYTGVGINDSASLKTLSWSKQKIDKVVNGVIVSKARDSIEPLVFPTAKIIGDIGVSTDRIYVDDSNFFEYEKDNDSAVSSINFSTQIFDNLGSRPAKLSATVSGTGTISAISILDGGKGYVGSSTSILIANPPISVVSGGTTATATANITNGVVTSVTITNAGAGYTGSIELFSDTSTSDSSSGIVTNTINASPNVVISSPEPIEETVSNITHVKGFSGIVTGISTITIGSTSGLRIGLQAASGQAFTDLLPTMPIFISNTNVGHGVTSLNESGNDNDVVGIGRTFLDNVYIIKNINRHSNNAEIEVNVKGAGINTTGINNAEVNLPYSVTFTANGNSNYVLNGKHRSEFGTQTPLSNAANGTIYLDEGDVLSIVSAIGAHPIRIAKTYGGAALTAPEGVTNNNLSNGTLTFNTAGVGHTSFVYYCTTPHASMNGVIYVRERTRGKFSWGYLTNSSGGGAAISRNNPIAIGVTGNTIISGNGLGISTFPTIQRRVFGIRDTGALRKGHTP
tara:strand:+ start:8686 stop:21657 length:12972 start_codon:yes stop_codon:yes gene_type:complete